MIIKDPIYKPTTIYGEESTHIVRDHFAVTSEPLFWVEDYAIGLTKSFGIAYWYINKSNPYSAYMMGCFIGSESKGEANHQASKEDLMKHLADNFPDHLEWLLFHPEWL